MEQTQQQVMPKKGGNKAVMIILIIMIFLLCAAAGYLGWQYIESGKKFNGLKVEKTKLTDQVSTQSKQLDSLKLQLKAMEGAIPASVADSLNNVITGLQTQIANAPTRIVYTGDDGGGGNKKEIEALKGEIADWTSKYDKLLKDMAALKTEKDKLAADVGTLNQEKTDLANKNKGLQDKVDLSAQLKFFDILLTGYKLDKKGKKTFEEKVKKVMGFDVSFKIQENAVADEGDKIAYIVINDPDKKVMTASTTNVFQLDGVDKTYTIQKSFYFNNKQTLIGADYKTKVALKPGEYTAEIYIDGKLSGTAVSYLKK